ncbi:hypothetical protein RF55_9263 [Lasius niger]|uniref:Uncharacterized protein n=1 Tax=Lasius niger TaxID=67767 RepID=A0A0J7KL22_LASNI|nr:hypothetical protein RF55_9263 [Lasius niger]
MVATEKTVELRELRSETVGKEGSDGGVCIGWRQKEMPGQQVMATQEAESFWCSVRSEKMGWEEEWLRELRGIREGMRGIEKGMRGIERELRLLRERGWRARGGEEKEDDRLESEREEETSVEEIADTERENEEMKRMNEGAERKKKRDGREKEAGGSEKKGEESVVASDKKDGKRMEEDTERSVIEGGKEGERGKGERGQRVLLEEMLERKVELRGVEERLGDDGKSILLVVLEKEEDRDEVLERRGEVGRRWRMSVDEDLTREERKMKWRIKERAREPVELSRARNEKEGEKRKECLEERGLGWTEGMEDEERRREDLEDEGKRKEENFTVEKEGRRGEG